MSSGNSPISPRSSMNPIPHPEPGQEFYFPYATFHNSSSSDENNKRAVSGVVYDPLTLTPDVRGINIYAPCIYNGPSLVYEKEPVPSQQQSHGKQTTTTTRCMRLRGGCHNKYYQLQDIKPQRLSKRCQTSRVTDYQDGKYDQYGIVSRDAELAYLINSKNSNIQSNDRRPSASSVPPSKCQINKTLDQPGINSSRFGGEAIQNAIADLARVPFEVERAVRSGMNENSKENKQLLRQATRKLNIPSKTKIYRDLLEINVVPEVNLKRISKKEKKSDPIPVLEDYIQVEFNRIKPYNFTNLIRQEETSSPVMTPCMDGNSNDYDIIQMDRIFINQ